MRIQFGFISCAAVLAAAVAIPAAQAASRGGASCGVTHNDCYPACVEFNSDHSDCAKTRNVCRSICGPKPVYPGGESADINRLEIVTPTPQKPRVSYESDRRPMDEEPMLDTTTEPSTNR